MYRDIEERRKFPRLQVKVPLQYKNLEKFPDICVSSVSRNVSRGGACFFCYEFVPLSTRMVVTLTLEEKKPTHIKVISKIAWIQKRPSAEDYNVGVEFLAMTREDGRFLGEFLDKNLT